MTNIEKLSNLYHRLPLDTPVAEGDAKTDGDVSVLVEALKSVCTEEHAKFVLQFPQPKNAFEVGMKAITAKEFTELNGGDYEYNKRMLQECGKIALVEMQYGEDDDIVYAISTIFPGLGEGLMTADNLTKEGAYWYEYYLEHVALPGYLARRPGRNTLHAIPVRESIEGNSKIFTFEEIEPYFENEEYISVSDCPCRTAARVLGHGCEHTHKDICIQLGRYAQSYIISGRSRRISKEEVYDILKKGEREGLVHQVSSFGIDEGLFICNCCGDHCAMLKNANILNYTDPNRSNFVAEINADNCVGCGACVETCNTNALSLGACYSVEPYKVPERANPAETEWTKEHWDPDWYKRTMVNEAGTAPCKTHCPAHIAVQGYIKKAAEGKYGEALKIIKRENPLPAVCGRICPHNCEKECSRGVVDEAMAIDDIKKFIADKELCGDFRYVPRIYEDFNDHIAVIGAGPSGISCAYYLASYGFKVTVFDKAEKPGGMLVNGIPTFRLEKDVVEAEIDVLREMGVEFKCGVEVGKDITIPELRAKGFKSFYIAIGLQDGGMLGIAGEDAKGVEPGIEFLKRVNKNNGEELNGKVVVIGGGSIGADTARTAIRCGAESVDLYCLEDYDHMPMADDDIEGLNEDGITINPGWGQTEIMAENGKCKSISFRKCLSVKDDDGSFNPKFDDSVTKTVDADYVFYCIGLKPQWGSLLDGTEVNLSPRGFVIADELTYQAVDDIFTGGDIYTGQKFCIDAIAAGKQAAISIKRYIQGNSLTLKRERNYFALDKEAIHKEDFVSAPRQRVQNCKSCSAKKTLRDNRGTLTEEQVKQEAQRCMGCGVTVVNPEKCIGCGVCHTRCEFDAIKLTRRYELAPLDTIGDFVQSMVDYAAERKENIARKKASEAK